MDWGWFMYKACVLTANYGDYDEVHNETVNGLRRNYMNELNLPLNLNAMMAAKFCKLNPFFFGIYGYYIWVDGSYEVIKEGLVDELIKILGDADIAFLPHKEIWGRDTIYEEAKFCRSLPLYKGQKMKEQVKNYKELGLPDTHKLYAGGLYITKLNERTETMFHIWWLENLTKTFQDQLSLPFAMWQSGVNVVEIPKYIYTDYLTIHAHKK